MKQGHTTSHIYDEDRAMIKLNTSDFRTLAAQQDALMPKPVSGGVRILHYTIDDDPKT